MNIYNLIETFVKRYLDDYMRLMNDPEWRSFDVYRNDDHFVSFEGRIAFENFTLTFTRHNDKVTVDLLRASEEDIRNAFERVFSSFLKEKSLEKVSL